MKATQPPQPARPRIDWQEAYARLERARQELEAGQHLPPEAVRQILEERARALARPLAGATTPTAVLELLVFSLAGERYGIETTQVLEVIPLRELTAVPCTPGFVLGVVNHRGRILAVLDLRRLLDLAGQDVPEGSRVVVLEAGGMTFGAYAEAVAGTVRVGAHELGASPQAASAARRAWIRGVTPEMVAVLDLPALAQDPRITINDEGS